MRGLRPLYYFSSCLLVQPSRRFSRQVTRVPLLVSSKNPSIPSIIPPGTTMIKRFIRKISTAASPFSQAPEEEPEKEDPESYQNAIKTLNTLQSNAATIAKMRQNRDQRRSLSVTMTTAALLESDLDLDALNSLDIVHVAGTKGKGMTCAFTESILRQAGLKTGFFSSPHLTAVRERIRINGRPLSEDHFARSFFSVYKKLQHLQDDACESPCEMPHYFRFLTIMAFHVFLEERVDAVILEVGIGGKYDTTNFIKTPVVVGISSLGLEHQHVLGDSLEEIAVQKAGIMKPGVPVYTVASHPPQIQELLRSHATQVECPLAVVQCLDLAKVTLGVDDGDGGVAGINASLAVHLANELLLKKHSHIFPRLSGTITSATDLQYSRDPASFLPFQIRGLELTRWDGRFQTVGDSQYKKISYFLDGAHTVDSLNITLQWFNRQTSAQRCLRLLIFNITGDRDMTKMMTPLVTSDIFDLAIFCPLISSGSSSADNWSALQPDSEDPQDLLEGCRNLAKIWEEIQSRSKGVVLSNAEETLDYVRELAEGERYRIKVLITGSLHLVGTFLQVLQPERNDE